ncbi:MAG: EAL domain-containing protein [Neomegalonema sp.]|nr:EAL domain-containing protein [Neomegalonema sp.]
MHSEEKLSKSRRAANFAAVLVGVVLAFVAIVVFAIVIQQERSKRQELYESAAKRASHLIEIKIQGAVRILEHMRAGVMLEVGHGHEDLAVFFRRYVDVTGLLKKYPQFRALSLGLISRSGPEAAKAVATPSHRWARESAFSVKVVATRPRSAEAVTLGYDLATSPVRGAALRHVRDSGESGATGRVSLKTDGYGVLLFTPLYRQTLKPATRTARRRLFHGVIIAPFQLDNFFTKFRGELAPLGLVYEIHDLGPKLGGVSRRANRHTVLANSMLAGRRPSSWKLSEMLVSRGEDTISYDLSVGGRKWRLLVAPQKSSAASVGERLAYGLLGLGGLLSIAAALLTRQHFAAAQLLGERVRARTRELEASKRALELSAAALAEANVVINKRAYNDELTGLNNRRALTDKLAQLLDDKVEGPDQITLLHLDLDRFKQINDTLGHAGGDFILRHVADILLTAFGEDAFIARVGGDEFVIIAPAGMSRQRILAAADETIQQCARPVEVMGRPCRCGASIGFVVAKRREINAQQLQINADLALYLAKANGRNRCEEFTDALKKQVVEKKQLADDLLRGLEEGEFFPVFQPQLYSESGVLAGVEALVRWRHPDKGVLRPDSFLPMAEELGVIAQIDRLVLDQSIEMTRRAAAHGIFIPKLSTNLSFGRLEHPDFKQSIADLQPADCQLSFEILESVFLDQDSGNALMNIDYMRELGYQIEVDDFGSGRASVVGLTKIKPDRFKIDRQLITPIVHQQDRRRLVAAVIEMGQALGIGVTAEGVQSDREAALLREMGCDVLQGYYCSPPLEEADLFKFVATLPDGGQGRIAEVNGVA